MEARGCGDVYATPDAEPAVAVDGVGTGWNDCSVYVDRILSLGALVTEVLVAFVMHKVLVGVAHNEEPLQRASTPHVDARGFFWKTSA